MSQNQTTQTTNLILFQTNCANNGIGVIITTKLARSVAISLGSVPGNIDVLIDNAMNVLKFIVSVAIANRSFDVCLQINAASDAAANPKSGKRKPAK